MSDSAEKPTPNFKDPQELEGEISESLPALELTKGDALRLLEEKALKFQETLEFLLQEEKKDLDEKQIEEIRALRLKNDQLQAEVDKIRDDNKGRRTFSENIFTAVVIWMFFVLMTVICAGYGHLHLSDSVLITLLTTATANVIALLVIVANYLFNKDKST